MPWMIVVVVYALVTLGNYYCCFCALWSLHMPRHELVSAIVVRAWALSEWPAAPIRCSTLTLGYITRDNIVKIPAHMIHSHYSRFGGSNHWQYLWPAWRGQTRTRKRRTQGRGQPCGAVPSDLLLATLPPQRQKRQGPVSYLFNNFLLGFQSRFLTVKYYQLNIVQTVPCWDPWQYTLSIYKYVSADLYIPSVPI